MSPKERFLLLTFFSALAALQVGGIGFAIQKDEPIMLLFGVAFLAVFAKLIYWTIKA